MNIRTLVQIQSEPFADQLLVVVFHVLKVAHLSRFPIVWWRIFKLVNFT